MPKGHERHRAVRGFDFDRLVSWLVGLFKPNALRRVDDLGHVGIGSTPDHDIDAGLGAFYIRANADKRQSGGFFLIA